MCAFVYTTWDMAIPRAVRLLMTKQIDFNRFLVCDLSQIYTQDLSQDATQHNYFCIISDTTHNLTQVAIQD